MKQRDLFAVGALAFVGAIAAITLIGEESPYEAEASVTPGQQTPEPTPQDEPRPKIGGIGDDVVIRCGGGKTFIGAEKDDFSAALKAVKANDSQGIIELAAAGRVFAVDDGTAARVIDHSFAMRRVRILEGDQSGSAGWIPMEFAVVESEKK